MHLCGMCVYFCVYLYVYCVSMCVYFLCICIFPCVCVYLCFWCVCIFMCVYLCMCTCRVYLCVWCVCVCVCCVSVFICLFFPTQLMHGLLSFSVVEQDGFLSKNQWNCFPRWDVILYCLLFALVPNFIPKLNFHRAGGSAGLSGHVVGTNLKAESPVPKPTLWTVWVPLLHVSVIKTKGGFTRSPCRTPYSALFLSVQCSACRSLWHVTAKPVMHKKTKVTLSPNNDPCLSQGYSLVYQPRISK